MIRILLFGGNGQLGRALVEAYESNLSLIDSAVLHSVGREVDVANSEKVREAMEAFRPDWVVNAAAVTDVDKSHVDPAGTFSVNAYGQASIARFSHQFGARSIYVSTEAVFDGLSSRQYSERDPCQPVSTYGASKVAGEMLSRIYDPAAVIVRTSWLYSSSLGANFPTRLMENLSRSSDPVPVVTDIAGNPTPTSVLSEAILNAIVLDIGAGTYHVCCQGVASKYEWAVEIVKAFGIDVSRIAPTQSAAVSSVAKRPPFVDLDCGAFLEATGQPLPEWREAWTQTARVADYRSFL